MWDYSEWKASKTIADTMLWCMQEANSMVLIGNSKLSSLKALITVLTVYEDSNEENNGHMAYWLSNTSALFFLLQKSLKAAGSSGATPSRTPPPPISLFGSMTMGFRSSPSSNNLAAAAALAVVRQVEAKFPDLLFKLQPAAYLEKIYGIIIDNLRKELSSLLSLCIQAPRTSKGNVLRSGLSFGKDSPSTHWQSIIDALNTLLSTLKENCVPPVLIQKIFTQTFSYINVQLFNSLLLHHECCTFSNGEYVKVGFAELELWCCQVKEEYAGSSWDELKHIRQAVGFLVILQKYRILYDEITNCLCPVISSMRVLMTEDSNDAVGSSFLLDDNSRFISNYHYQREKKKRSNVEKKA